MELREIARDVYAGLQEDKGLGWSNSGLVNSGGGLVVDTFWDLPHTQRLIDEYARVWSGPARRVVNTHHNGDHCWGNQLFEGSEILGHRRCAEHFAALPPAALQALKQQPDSDDPAVRGLAEGLRDWDFSGIELTPPTTLVDDDGLVLDQGDLEVRLEYVGPAHTAGDLIVHVPERSVVFAGDILFRLCTPIGWEGTTARWRAALDRIVELDPDVVVPGHGPLCGVEGPREMKAYLEYVCAEAKLHFEAGRSALEAARRIDPGPYADWTEPERIVFNVERAYRELRGDPWDAPLDFMALARGMAELRARPRG